MSGYDPKKDVPPVVGPTAREASDLYGRYLEQARNPSAGLVDSSGRRTQKVPGISPPAPIQQPAPPRPAPLQNPPAAKSSNIPLPAQSPIANVANPPPGGAVIQGRFTGKPNAFGIETPTVPPGGVDRSRVYTQDDIAALAKRNVVPSTYEADKAALDKLVSAYIQGGDIGRAEKLSLTPEHKAAVQAAYGERQQARAIQSQQEGRQGRIDDMLEQFNKLSAQAGAEGIGRSRRTALQQQAGSIARLAEQMISQTPSPYQESAYWAQAGKERAATQGLNLENASRQQISSLAQQLLTEPDPAKRQTLASNLLAMQGKSEPQKYDVFNVKGGTDPTTLADNPDQLYIVDKATGEVRLVNQQPSAAPSQGGGGPVRVSTEADVAKLPKGSQFIGPDGKIRIKP